MIKTHLCASKDEVGASAAALGAEAIEAAIASQGRAAIVLATGASQFEVLAALVRRREVDWSRVTAFHLDDYIGMDDQHPASFRRYLRERFVAHVPPLQAMHFIRGDAADLAAELSRINELIGMQPIDVAFAGIGENGHLAFNDPPADFAAEEGFKVVELDERCRRQQLGEGWFRGLEEVPLRAISMTVRQLMRSRVIVLSVPDARKADAVRDALEGPVSPLCPASILQRHPACHLYLDPPAAAGLKAPPRLLD